MAISSLIDAPPTLVKLFPECSTLDEKAFKFLEVKYECGTVRRTARVLQEMHKGTDAETIHHQTVKAIYEYLRDTDVYFRFQETVSEMVEDFYSKKLMVTLFERYEQDLQRAEKLIAKYLKEDTKVGEEEALKWLKFKKTVLDRVSTVALAVRGHFRKVSDIEDDKPSTDNSKARKELLEEAEEHESSRDRH